MINKTLVAVFFGLVLSTYGFLAAYAAGSELVKSESTAIKTDNVQEATRDTPTNSMATDEATDPQVSKGAHNSKSRLFWGWPHRARVFIAEAVIHTPVALVSKSKEATTNDIIELVGDHRNPLFLGLAGTISLPFGLTSGIFDGVISGVGDSWKHSSN
jgi:hypothetical protein